MKELLTKIRKKAKHSIKRIMEPLRRQYCKIRSRKLNHRDITILSNNCCAGIMYHDLNLRFDSPTINLWMPHKHFFEFLNHLDYYTQAEPEQIYMDGIRYPVGRIRREDKEIHLYFLHYASFSTARQKWVERCQRIHWDRLYVVYNATNIDRIDDFSELQFEHKVMLTHCDDSLPVPENVVDMPIYQRSLDYDIIMKFKSLVSLKRWLDDFDYVSFLNQT